MEINQGELLPLALHEARRRKRNPWNKSAQRKSDLLKKLAEAEKKHDFYSRLYKQYTIDLLRLAIYARALSTQSPNLIPWARGRSVV